jgi:peptidyl-prolyl cis-trans isomerase D
MAEAMASDLMLQYLAGLRARYGVTINRSVIDTMYRPQE